ncbi:hypothetical protein ACFQU2_17365 [Siccirubricoccus deserti]
MALAPDRPVAPVADLSAPVAVLPETLLGLPSGAPAEAMPEAARVPRLYLVHPLLVGPLPAWDALFAHVAGLGFDIALLAPPFAAGASGNLLHIADPDAPHPILEASGDSAEALRILAEKARAQGLALYLDLILDRAAVDGVLPRSHAAWVAGAVDDLPDPRVPRPSAAPAGCAGTTRRWPKNSSPGGRRGCAASSPRASPASAA